MTDSPISTYFFWVALLTIYIALEINSRSFFATNKPDLGRVGLAVSNPLQFAKALPSSFLISASSILGIIDACTLGWQCFNWLHIGQWVPFSTIDALRYVSSNAWLDQPGDWIGVHKILDASPGVFAILIVVFFGLFIGIEMAREFQERKNNLR